MRVSSRVCILLLAAAAALLPSAAYADVASPGVGLAIGGVFLLVGALILAGIVAVVVLVYRRVVRNRTAPGAVPPTSPVPPASPAEPPETAGQDEPR